MHQIRASITLIPVLAVAVLAGCKKESLDTDTYIALDNAIADGSFQDMMNVVTQQAVANGIDGFSSGTANGKLLEDCPTTTFSEPLGTFPNTMTVDFGVSCTTGYLGVERSGKVIATFTGPYSAEGTTITITTDNYYVNGNKVEGTKTITNEGLNDAGNLEFVVVMVDGVVTLATGETISWNSSRTREWIAGDETLEIEDDVYSVTDGPGVDNAVEGINRSGTPFTAHIAEPLVRALDCRWFRSGVLEVTPEEMLTRSIDFGSGDCDNVATLSIGEFETEITLPY
ncbi:MAG TPA: hypothetical protein PK511_09285 [Chitinophagales bacterium]|nr:hypothetical protein [Chitinophagales bacterium]